MQSSDHRMQFSCTIEYFSFTLNFSVSLHSRVLHIFTCWDFCRFSFVWPWCTSVANKFNTVLFLKLTIRFLVVDIVDCCGTSTNKNGDRRWERELKGTRHLFEYKLNSCVYPKADRPIAWCIRIYLLLLIFVFKFEYSMEFPCGFECATSYLQFTQPNAKYFKFIYIVVLSSSTNSRSITDKWDTHTQTHWQKSGVDISMVYHFVTLCTQHTIHSS